MSALKPEAQKLRSAHPEPVEGRAVNLPCSWFDKLTMSGDDPEKYFGNYSRRGIRFAWFLILLLGFPPAAHAMTVRILLHENLTRVTVSADGVSRVLTARDPLPQLIVSSSGPVRVQGKPYRGVLEILPAGRGRLRVVNRVDLEDYIRGVVPSEMPSSWPLEALKAQAVAARSYALYRMGRSPEASDAGILRSTVMDQVYRGMRAESDTSNAAVEATRGEALAVEDGRSGWLVAYFHSCCGGVSERPASVWGVTTERESDNAWLVANRDVFGERPCVGCATSPWRSWTTTFTRRAVANALRRYGAPRTIDGVRVVSRTASGRVARFEITGRTGSRRVSRTLSGQVVRMALSPDRLRSLECEVQLTRTSVVFRGAGWGHGVGLCQWGARGLADAGLGYRAIIESYYPGALWRSSMD